LTIHYNAVTTATTKSGIT